MLWFARGDSTYEFSPDEMNGAIQETLARLGARKKVLAIPPDYTRCHSQAGKITEYVWRYYGDALSDILPALGTHAPMSDQEITAMFGAIPHAHFRIHRWRTETVTVGTVPSEYVRDISENAVSYDWPAQVNRLLLEGGHDLILSIGQVVPHEVIGMANYNKNIFVGTGGAEGISKSHFLGAAFGMERIMGRADNPVRALLEYASINFTSSLPIVYVLTVVGRDKNDRLCVKGLFIGDDRECFDKAAALSLQINFTMVEKPLKKVVVFLDPAEYKSTWLGNKSIYRTRMAIADGGELIVLAPGVCKFGEDREIDVLIRKYGYSGTQKILDQTRTESDLQANLSAAAHLIHGSSEGRFRIVYCPGALSLDEITSAGYEYADYGAMQRQYPVHRCTEGFNTLTNGEEFFYINNPALGLWAARNRF